MNNKNIWITYEDVLRVAGEHPDTKIWVVSKDMTEDYLTTAKEIAKVRSDFRDYNFSIVKEETHETMQVTEVTECQVVSSYDVKSFEKELNKVLSNEDLTIKDIKYSVTVTADSHTLYTALVIYSYGDIAN